MIKIQASYSRISCFKHCKQQYKYRYIDKLKLIQDATPDNALIVGNTVHLAMETNIEEAREFYYSQYPIITDRHIEEMMKIEIVIPKVKDILKDLNIYSNELRISNRRFIGIVDLIIRNDDGTVDVFDFKYSNNIKNYLESGQLHIYKYFLEQMGFKVRKLGFIFVPKCNIRQKKTETLYQFRQRLIEETNKLEVKIAEIKYDPNKVIEFLSDIIDVTECKEYEKNITKLCDWCDYQNYCLKGEDYMILPSSERRELAKVSKRKIWIYGPSFSGKTTMLDDAPNPLNLNTDGNIEFVTMPYVPIKDEVTVEGRVTRRKLAWEVFKDTISELEKKQNDFKTIIIDLLEDTREMCRVYKYDELGIQHESDSGFGKGWDIIKTEYLSTMRRFFNLDYENIVVISHEDVSKDITKKNGQNITRIAPNIQEAIATKIAGMVDIVARVVVEDDGTRTLNFKTNEVVFGGGRLKGIKTNTIPLSWDELMKVYDEANKGKVEKKIEEIEDEPKKEEVKEEAVEGKPKEETTQEEAEKNTRRRRKKSE
ncbi:AAA family ATPase [Romboutsia sp. 1001285H_161024_C4]|uniref:AAA family ATPase n=1 Tax=Romboutsia sp. 1001285H_161024_C4 TaxID=2787109 RepID=UPI002ED1F511